MRKTIIVLIITMTILIQGEDKDVKKSDWATIIDFDVSSSVKEDIDGSAIAVMLEEPLSIYYKLVDRKQLVNAMKELKFQSSDLSNSSKAKTIGKMIGAEYIITGTVVQFGSIIITAKVLEIETGIIKQTAKVTLKGFANINKDFSKLSKILSMNDKEKEEYLKLKNNPKPKIIASVSKDTVLVIKYSPEQEKYIKLLKSNSDNQLYETARDILENYSNDKIIVDFVAKVLEQGYNKDVYNRTHTLAMSWLCKILGASQNSKYKPLLTKIANNASSEKLKLFAKKALSNRGN